MKRLIALLLAFSMLLGAAGCGGKGGASSDGTPKEAAPGASSAAAPSERINPAAPPALEGVVALPPDGIGEPGRDFELLEVGEVTGWDDETVAPFFNPLGDRSLYEEASSRPANEPSSMDVNHLAEDRVTSKRFTVTGQEFEATLTNEKLTRNWLLYMAKEQGAVLYPSRLDRVVFSLMENETTRWWVVGELTESDGVCTARLQMRRTNFVPSGKTVTVVPSGDWYDGTYYFYTDCVPGKLQSAELTLKCAGDTLDDGIRVDVRQSFYRNGTLEASVEDVLGDPVFQRLAVPFGETQTFDDVPIVDGMLEWTYRLENMNPPEEVAFTIREIADVPAVAWGDEPGLVKLVGAPGGGGAFLKRLWGTAYLSDFEEDMLSNPYQDEDGNYCIVAPAGYYELNIGEKTVGEIEHTGRMQLLPVSSGEVTTVTVPQELRAAYNSMSGQYGSFESEAGGVEILSAEDKGDTAVLSLLVNDPLEREVLPEPSDLKITENGLPGTVTKIERLPGQASVVLCLDTSGSMKGSMAAAVAAAKRFVESLPDNTAISLVQFAQKITEHKGTDKQSVLDALDQVKEGGATAMYDAVDRALMQLSGAKRPYVVLFSDGADSREPGIDGTGSTLTQEEIRQKITESGATVLTIGFGAGHDPKALVEMSGASENGAYFIAASKESLDAAFASVSAKFGNQFAVTYERPTARVDEKSDVPVVSMMMDISGSMNHDPADPDVAGEDVGFRIDRVKRLFHDFVLKLPQGTLMQFNVFNTPPLRSSNVHFIQMTTDQKASVLRGLGSVDPTGGTPILEALTVSLAELEPISSTKRVLVFFTDAALEVWDDGSGAQKLDFEQKLKALRKAGIRVLFAGLGGGDYAQKYDGVFRSAAQLAGGDYVITDSVEDIAAKLAELLAKLDTPIPAENSTQLSLALDCKTEDGSRMSYATALKLETPFSVREAKGDIVAPSLVSISTGEPFIRYDRTASQRLYGSDSPSSESVILHRMAFEGAAASNRFAELRVKEAYFMSSFKGLTPSWKEFLALDVDLTFKKQDAAAPEIGYQIPSVFQHMYVSVNDGRMMPASKATWLAQAPLCPPGESSVQVMEKKDAKGKPLPEGETVSGMLVFLIDKNSMNELTQLSLHSYDVDYGHIELPLVGSMPQRLLEMSALPTEEPADLGQSFSMKLSGVAAAAELESVKLEHADAELDAAQAAKNASFQVVEAQFESNVQALLSLEPDKRFYYRTETDSGDLLASMSPVVFNLPLGFVGDTMLAPGSSTPVRLPYVVPDALLKSKSSLWGDLQGGSFELPVVSGAPWQGVKKGERFEHEYFTLAVNELALLDPTGNVAALDFTVIDKKDGEGVGGFDDLLMLRRENTAEDVPFDQMNIVVRSKGLGDFATDDVFGPVGVVKANTDSTRRLVYGASLSDAAWGAFDGQSRRGVLLYELPAEELDADWSLVCDLLPELKLPLGKSAFENRALLAELPYVDIDGDFQRELDEKVSAAVAQYAATRVEPSDVQRIGLSDAEIIGSHVPSPRLTVYGSRLLGSVHTDEDFANVMNPLRWMPTAYSYLNSYSPEAVLTQGWGGDADFYTLAVKLLSQLGYRPEKRGFLLTEAGRSSLQKLSGLVWDGMPQSVLAVTYTDAQGKKHAYVPAFRREAQELNGFGYLEESGGPTEPLTARIVVTASGELTGEAGAAAQQLAMTDIGNLLGGGEGGASLYESVTLLDAEFDLTDAGRDFIDVSFVAVSKSPDGLHDKVTAVADTCGGLLTSPNCWADTGNYLFDRIDVEITGSGVGPDGARHTLLLSEGEKLTDLFQSFAVNTPELTDAAAAAYEKAVAAQAACDANPVTNYGTARWVAHAALSRLVRTLGKADDDLCEQLGLQSGRGENVLALGCTLRSDGSDAVASTDLMLLSNSLYLTPESEEAGEDIDALQRTYNAAYGMMASQAEAMALPDGGGKSIVDVWAALPDEAGMLLIDSNDEQRKAYADALEAEGYPAYLIERLRGVEGEETAFLVPTRAAQIDGKPRWAWLEIDVRTMEAVSVFDTGERSGMAGYALGLTPKSSLEFTIGAFTGIACSHFAVATYALELENYADIRACAANLMAYVYAQVKGVQGGVDDLKGVLEKPLNAAAGEAAKSINDAFKKRSDIDVMALYGKYKSLGAEPTFSDGFKSVVELYFGVQLGD